MRRSVEERVGTGSEPVRWIGHPAVFACITVLVLNDHVLKDRYPGRWTGKLSDFAGLAVISVVLAAGVGPRRGLALAGAAFGVLKLVPGVAETAAPLLGGITRRDPTDLLALTVLLPIWIALRPRRTASVVAEPSRGSRASGIWAGLRATVASVAPVVGVVFAAVGHDRDELRATTSCGHGHGGRPGPLRPRRDGCRVRALGDQ